MGAPAGHDSSPGRKSVTDAHDEEAAAFPKSEEFVAALSRTAFDGNAHVTTTGLIGSHEANSRVRKRSEISDSGSHLARSSPLCQK